MFCALVAPVAESFKAALNGQQSSFHSLPDEEKEETALSDKVEVTDFVDYIYDHFDELNFGFKPNDARYLRYEKEREKMSRVL